MTTRNPDGSTNVAPMGPHCLDTQLEQFELRPFQTSTTFTNLQNTREGILHITDDVLLFAHAALDSLPDSIQLAPGECVACDYLADACRVLEFTCHHIDTSHERAVVHCRTVCHSRIRDFFGFNRAKHAVIEASILATRLDFLPASVVREKFVDLRNIVSKTGGEREIRAFQFLLDYVNSSSETAATRHGSA
ncbi:MAG: DUF447 domain-containing protein [Pirellulaceae bacterium]